MDNLTGDGWSAVEWLLSIVFLVHLQHGYLQGRSHLHISLCKSCSSHALQCCFDYNRYRDTVHAGPQHLFQAVKSDQQANEAGYSHKADKLASCVVHASIGSVQPSLKVPDTVPRTGCRTEVYVKDTYTTCSNFRG